MSAIIESPVGALHNQARHEGCRSQVGMIVNRPDHGMQQSLIDISLIEFDDHAFSTNCIL